jgi:hypothetical protein
VWNFDGWSADPGAAREHSSGRAAGTIENTNFILLDIQATNGQMVRGKSGSMLFAVEPGIGPTLTAWGDASPRVGWLTGSAHGDASVFRYSDTGAVAVGAHRHSVTITFAGNDQWTLDIRDLTSSGGPVVGEYAFTRAGP